MPTSTSRALNLLFASAVAYLLTTLPFFSPTNIFQLTQSRLQTPTGVLFTRLSALRSLTPSEESLRKVLEHGGLEARLLYLRFGPDTLGSCPFADPKNADASMIYLIYSLPTLLAPHVIHLCILALVTSTAIAGQEAGRWRTLATIAGVILAVAEFSSLASYDHQINARASKASEIDFFFWKLRFWSRLGIAAVDAILGWMIYLSATKRAFVQPQMPAERIEASSKQLEAVLGKLRGLGAVRNVVFRNTAMRGEVERYWIREEGMMRSIFEEREVVGALNEALSQVNVDSLGKGAEEYVDSVLGSMVTQPPTEGS